MTKPTLSLKAIADQVATEDTVALEPYLPNGDPSGIVFQVRSDQAPSVVAGIAKLVNGRRRKDHLLEAQASKARPGEVFAPIEDDIDFTRKLVAVRLAGWSGLEDEFSEANAIKLFALIPGFQDQILEKAKLIGGFTNASPKA